MKGTILIVDDIPQNLRLLMRMLTSRGHRVWAASSGAHALSLVEKELPDLILLDIMMPDMDGYAVCRALKADERTQRVPVIFISALDHAFDKVEAFSAGGVDYVTKPFQLEEVLARVEAHLTMRRLQKSLEQQVAELDAFAHTVAHDLKSPLNLITGYAGILADELAGVQDPLIQKSIATVTNTAEKMAFIIDELLLLAQVRKREQVELEPLDMARIVIAAQARLERLIAEHEAEISLPEAWPTALGYGPWVEEVWANYISNALKYGGRPPRVELGGRSNGNGSVCFWVRDNGAGLDPAIQARLFTEFTRLQQASVEGQGLGLSIVRRIIDKLGGEVGVESDAGEGSTFFFTLPGPQHAQGKVG
jgi:two-component system sensor histidine kinase/response regulator